MPPPFTDQVGEMETLFPFASRPVAVYWTVTSAVIERSAGVTATVARAPAVTVITAIPVRPDWFAYTVKTPAGPVVKNPAPEMAPPPTPQVGETATGFPSASEPAAVNACVWSAVIV